MDLPNAFHSPYTHGFVRVAVCVPRVRVADPGFNAERTLVLARRASDEGAVVALFPELGISAYSCDDLFHQETLLRAVTGELERILEESRGLRPLLLVGAPLRCGGALFNCAVAIRGGRILGVVPKCHLPNYREFYEKRQFAAARQAVCDAVPLFGESVPFGADLIFEADNLPDFAVHAEICEDLWTPSPPSSLAALAGATILTNLSASNITIGKAEYRRTLCASQSGRCVAAYLYAAAGPGESTTDLAWDGDALIYENGALLAEAERFSGGESLVIADVDLERLAQERMRLTSFQDCAADQRDRIARLRRIPFSAEIPQGITDLRRVVPRFPYVPDDPERRDERCREAYRIQVHGLVKRLESCGLRKLVVGVSGGLDSTQALIVAAKTMDRLGWGRENIIACTMPGFATSGETLANARSLMKAMRTTALEIDIRPSCRQMLADIGHPFAEGENLYDVTFENVQAGERTSHLFRLANHHNGIVLGTGDLSELALGWCTYGVGDHMSHYNVNASVPKTLVQHLIHWVAETGVFDAETGNVLERILATEISPELVPPGEGGAIQSTQAVIGPYELQDFNLYHTSRFGYRPAKTAFLAWHAWRDARVGRWPEGIAESARNAYTLGEIRRWLEVFLFRFFQTSQFKRSCVPNGPKVGSGGSLSPRGDWRAPSDAEAEIWLEDLQAHVPSEDPDEEAETSGR